MAIFRLKSRQNILKKISFILFHWQQCIHLYIFFIILSIACLISYRQPFGLLFHFKYIYLKKSPIDSTRENLLNQHKQEQKIAYQWLENLFKNPENYPNLISNQTHQSHFYNYLQLTNTNHDIFSSYTLLNKPKQFSFNSND